MKRWERWSFNILTAVVAATGFVYFWMKYLVEPSDPFAVVNHPWQTTTLALHLIASPFFILIFGIVLNSHVMKKLRASNLPNRRSGYVSLVTFAVMVLSGYLLQVASTEQWLQMLVAAHLGSGVLFSVAYVAHLAISVRLIRARQDTAIREVA